MEQSHAESPGSSQWVVGIDQSSRSYSECRATVLRGRVQLSIRPFRTVSNGGFAPWVLLR